MPTSGLDLRLERVAARVKIKDLAAAMDRHRATVIGYEKAGAVEPEVAAQYREALATLRDVATPTEGTAA
jgi:hypothetical protein